MKETEFNLLDEKWIRVRLPDNSIQEVSITEALLHAQDYVDLAGEMATQDAAMLRLLLAIPLTVFYRVDLQGEDAPLKKPDYALLRWKELWNLGHFPEKPIRDYLKKWHDRFWLFHPERPFWQVVEADIGTKYEAAKLNGEISESSNKIRLFSVCSGEEKNKLSYSQAARWLLYINGFDDTSSKAKGKNLPAVGTGWLGKIGFIQATGRNLFQTIMLNLVLLQDGQKIWEKNTPCWELEKPRSAERTEIASPDNLAQLLTLQSRRLLLHRGDGSVVGFSLLGGDFFQKENAFVEQMTIWRKAKEKKNEPIKYIPCQHDPAKQFWREFPTIFCESAENSHKSGIVQWITLLQDRRLRFLNPQKQIKFKISGLQYGDSNYFVKDSFGDELSFQTSLLDELNKTLQIRISNEIESCESVANLIGLFAHELDMAEGNSNDQVSSPARTQFYFNVDVPFRQWLQSIDATQNDLEAKFCEWQITSRNIAKKMAREMISNVSSAAYVGHKIKSGEKTTLYTAPKAYNRFLSKLWKIYPKTDMEGGDK